MNQTKPIFTAKLRLTFGLVLLTALTGCLPGMRDGPPGLPGLPGPPHLVMANPVASPTAIVTVKDSNQNGRPELVQTEYSVNAVSKEEEEEEEANE